ADGRAVRLVALLVTQQPPVSQVPAAQQGVRGREAADSGAVVVGRDRLEPALGVARERRVQRGAVDGLGLLLDAGVQRRIAESGSDMREVDGRDVQRRAAPLALSLADGLDEQLELGRLARRQLIVEKRMEAAAQNGDE